MTPGAAIGVGPELVAVEPKIELKNVVSPDLVTSQVNQNTALVVNTVGFFAYFACVIELQLCSTKAKKY